MPGETIERYEGLLDDHQWLAVALCWTVIEPITAAVDVAEVVRRLGGDPGTLRPRSLATTPAPAESLYFVDQVGPAVTVMEVNDFQGSRPEVLRWLSDGARVHSAYWNVNAVNRLSYAAYGTLVTALDAGYPRDRYGADPDALDDDLRGLLNLNLTDDEDDEDDAEESPWRAAMLACIEARTGVALDPGWPARDHQSFTAPPLPSDPRPPVAGIEADVDATLRLAPAPARRAALTWLLEHVVATFDLAAEPALRTGLAAFRAGHHLDDLACAAVFAVRDRLWLDWERHPTGADMEHDPGWRRAQAGWALGAALCARPWQDPLEAIQHVRLAYGEQWPRLTKDLKSRLRALS